MGLERNNMKPKPKLLIIDDNVEDLNFLSDFGYDVNILSRGKEVIEYLKSTSDTYDLIIAPVQVVGAKGKDTMEDTVRGWIRPELPLPDFLEDYSRLGGTHHAALVYGDITEDLLRFAQIMGWNAAVLG